MKMLSWKSRGLGHPSKIAALKDLIQSEKPEIVLIQETKQDQSEVNRVLNQQKRYSGCASEARGASGGILTMWDNRKWSCNSTKMNQHWINVNLERKEDGAMVRNMA